MINIDTYKFYRIGSTCFGIIAVANLIVFFQQYNAGLTYNVFDVVSRVSGIFFNFVLFGFFRWLYNQLPPKENIMSVEELRAQLKGGQSI